MKTLVSLTEWQVSEAMCTAGQTSSCPRFIPAQLAAWLRSTPSIGTVRLKLSNLHAKMALSFFELIHPEDYSWRTQKRRLHQAMARNTIFQRFVELNNHVPGGIATSVVELLQISTPRLRKCPKAIVVKPRANGRAFVSILQFYPDSTFVW